MEPFVQSQSQSTLLIKEWMDLNPSSNLIAGFTNKYGGVSEPPYESLNLGFHVPDQQNRVFENRKRLAQILDFPIEKWVIGQQIHSTKIHIVSKEDLGKGAMTHENALQGIDGFITNEIGILCAALFADCVPLFFYDPSTKWIGIAHAGWRGTVNEIAKDMVTNLVSRGARIENIKVAIGPSIGQKAYEVNDQVIQHVKECYQNNVFVESNNDRYLLDLKKLNAEITKQAGVLPSNISVTNYCTYNDKQFFSHRRDQGKTGRMLGFIGFSE